MGNIINMNKKVKTTKFKVINAKINKKLVADEFDLQKIKSKGGYGDGGNKPGGTNKITLSKLFDKVDNLSDNLSKLAKIVADGFAEQAKFNTRIEKEVLDLRCDVSNLKHGVVNLSTRIDHLVKVNSLKE